jgi:hypothetical protein
MQAEYVVRHLGPGGCGRPAFWVNHPVDDSLIVYGVRLLDGSVPPACGIVACGACGRRLTITSELPRWVERVECDHGDLAACDHGAEAEA